MANTVPSPNMFMPVPVVGVDPGPDWANNINASLSVVDSHNHTTGQGVPITPAGININTDLPFSNNYATSLKASRYESQPTNLAGALDLNEVYVLNGELHYIDALGQDIPITANGSVTGASGTITGLPSGTASASFAGGTFTWQSATSTPATMNFGSAVIGQQVASGKNVTIAANASMGSNYTLTLPTGLPVTTQSTLVTDTLGNTSFLSFRSSTYTPTPISITNVSSATGLVSYYTQVSFIVTVFGVVSVTPTSTGTTVVGVSLPVASTISNVRGVAGTGQSENTANTTAFVVGSVANNSAAISFTAGTTSAVNMYFSFSYQIV